MANITAKEKLIKDDITITGQIDLDWAEVVVGLNNDHRNGDGVTHTGLEPRYSQIELAADLSVGTPVQIIDDGGPKIDGISISSAPVLKTIDIPGDLYTLNIGYAGSSSGFNSAIDNEGRILIIYGESTVAGQERFVIGSVNGQDITWVDGDIPFLDNGTTQIVSAMVYLTDIDVFIIHYFDSGAGQDYLVAARITSGSTVTFGTPLPMGGFYRKQFLAPNSSVSGEFVVTRSLINPGDDHRLDQLVRGSVNPSTLDITTGTPQLYFDNGYPANFREVLGIAHNPVDNNFLIAHKSYTLINQPIQVQAFTLSGDTFTLGSLVTPAMYPGQFPAQYGSVTYHEGENVYVLGAMNDYFYNGNKNFGFQAYSVSGVNITWGTQINDLHASSEPLWGPRLFEANDNALYFSYVEETLDPGFRNHYRKLNITGTSLSFEPGEIAVTTPTYDYTVYQYGYLSGFHGVYKVPATGDIIHGFSYIYEYITHEIANLFGEVFSPTPQSFQPNKFHGILQETGTAGQIKNVALLGRGISRSHNSLVPGSDYYIQEDGNLGTTETRYPIGYARNTSSIVLSGNEFGYQEYDLDFSQILDFDDAVTNSDHAINVDNPHSVIETQTWTIAQISDPPSFDYYSSPGQEIYADTTSNSFIVWLPDTPSIGDKVRIFDAKGNFLTNNLTVNGNGSPIKGISDTFICDINGMILELIYVDATYGWNYKLDF